ncbi:MAG: LamG-like jellyroll fold domain-containing protein [Marinobacter sp.]|nr:LamG-like jellyroll fold domain-containing protein [Marinobacter sp.]
MPKYNYQLDAENDGLIHYWPINEASGATVADVIGGWDGTVDDELQSLTATQIDDTIVATPAGSGRDVSVNWVGPPGGDFTNFAPILLPSPPSTSVLSAITFRCRYFHRTTIWEDDTNFSYSDLVLLGGATFVEEGILIEIYEYQGGAETYIKAGGSGTTITSNVFTEGQWHDVIVAGDASGVSIYVNGAQVGTAAGSSTFAIYTTTDTSGTNIPGMVGAYRDSSTVNSSTVYHYKDSSTVDGIIQDVAIWNRKLTAQEVTDLNTDGTSEPLIGSLGTGVQAQFNVTMPITADFAVDMFMPDVSFDVDFPISATATAYQDWLSLLDPIQLQEFYTLTITGSADSLPDVVVPISSWQATNQAGARQSYVQAVIPAASQWLDAITARQSGELVIRKGFRFSDGSERSEEILRSNFDAFRYDRGAGSLSATLSGYLGGKQVQSGSRTLKGVRSISVDKGKYRVRADIDLFLQPGMTVTADDVTFRADYINYYVSDNDKFCEVSDR